MGPWVFLREDVADGVFLRRCFMGRKGICSDLWNSLSTSGPFGLQCANAMARQIAIEGRVLEIVNVGGRFERPVPRVRVEVLLVMGKGKS